MKLCGVDRRSVVYINPASGLSQLNGKWVYGQYGTSCSASYNRRCPVRFPLSMTLYTELEHPLQDGTFSLLRVEASHPGILRKRNLSATARLQDKQQGSTA